MITAHGKTFEIRYGYYEETDRHAKYNDPIEIYPNFIKTPVYTDDGVPFATATQDACEHFSGERNEDSMCSECPYYRKCEELLGICTRNTRKQTA